MNQLIIKMIFNCKYLWTAEMMLFTLEQYIWVLLLVNQQESSLILVLSIWPSQVFYVMMRLQEITSSRNTTQCLVVLFKEIKHIKDVKQCATICTNRIQIKYYQKHLQNWLMALQNYKVSSGKIILAFNL